MSTQQEALIVAQRTLKERTEELRTALAANSEMQQILQTKSVVVPSSSSGSGDGGQASMTASSSSSRRSNRRTAQLQGGEKDGDEDITHEKLQSEIKVFIPPPPPSILFPIMTRHSSFCNCVVFISPALH